MKKILITGGAGFIGLNLTRRAIKSGYGVNILDNFSPQVHASSILPADLLGKVTLFKGNICDRELVEKALENVEIIIHLAAETGTGQSMYEIAKYFEVNVQGTALLLDVLQNGSASIGVKSLIVASSRAIYGEGSYRCPEHGIIYPSQRLSQDMERGIFEPKCGRCSNIPKLISTDEHAPFSPMSFYGLTKQVQEQAFLLAASTLGINGFALRYQNVYGPGQSLKNPYTGILAIFSNLARQNQAIEIYEDGLESRDFVYIDDVVEATMLAVDYGGSFVGALNVGSGLQTNVIRIANEICKFFDSQSQIIVTGKFRVGDIRHNIADISMAKKILGYVPKIPFNTGLSNFLKWAATQPTEDPTAYNKSVMELSEKGLMGKSQLR